MASTTARNRYNAVNYHRFAVFTDKDTANRIKEAAEQEGQSLNAFIMDSVIARLEGGNAPKVAISDTAGAKRLLTEYTSALADYQRAKDNLKTAHAKLKQTSDRMADVIKDVI